MTTLRELVFYFLLHCCLAVIFVVSRCYLDSIDYLALLTMSSDFVNDMLPANPSF